MSSPSVANPDYLRILDDLEETTSRGMRVNIVADCLLERLVELKLDDGSCYLDRIEHEIAAILVDPSASPLGHLFTDEVRAALAAEKKTLLRIAIRDEFLENGLDVMLWNQALARLGETAGETGFTRYQADRFLQLCCMHGWEPLWNGATEDGRRSS